MIVPRTVSLFLTVFLAMTVCVVSAQSRVDFGDDESAWAMDGECDDPRFQGDGVADTLMDGDRFHDATDCRLLFNQGRITLRTSGQAGIEFGDDESSWAEDGECDDPRFEGEGVASTLLEEDSFHDATDCRDLFNVGQVRLRDEYASDSPSSADFSASGEWGDDSSEWANDGECDDPRFQGEGAAETLVDEDVYRDATDCRTLFDQGRITLNTMYTAPVTLVEGGVVSGRLEAGDGTLSSGEHMDGFIFEGVSGQEVVIDLRSGDFDPYLIVRTPGGEQFDNDDHEGDAGRSLLALTLDESGTYSVRATSYQPGEVGRYTVRMILQASIQAAGPRAERGRLEAGDSTLQSGEYVDAYEFVGRPGQRVTIDLRSSDFDTYVILADPNGEQQENDDAQDGIGHSLIETDLAEVGTYQVWVTSYEPGESGAYELTIERADVADGRPRENRDVSTLRVGGSANGQLEAGDQQLETGKYQDIYVFNGSAGQTVNVALTSPDFDTYVGLVTPSGDVIENDDFEGNTDRSEVKLALTESGRYRVLVTSYAADEVGNYRVAVNSGGLAASTMPAGSSSGGRIYGIFAGISDYPGTGNDLAYTAEDAIRVHDALVRGAGMRPENAVMLTDSDATSANVTRAVRDIASQVGPDDTFVFFYSGHGNRVARPDGPTGTDPDAMDETIELYDGSVRDDELRSIFDQVHAGTTLLLLDSCFSGGFAKDIISVPGRMGMFSSEEDVTSQVAVKFQAGGYLSLFLEEGIGDGYADRDEDGAVTAIELSQYVHDRYRGDVKASNPEDYVRTGGPQSGYQHLVVDRGSVAPFDVLFERAF